MIAGGSDAMDQGIALVRRFADAWERCDIEGVISALHPAITYENVPAPALHGHEAVRAFITPSLSVMSHMTWEFLTCLASSDGLFVAAERVDTFFFPEGEVAVQVFGLFALSDGLILRWRDYCDLGHFGRQMAEIGRSINPALCTA